MFWNKLPKSEKFNKVIAVIGIAAAVLVIFQAGVWFGYRKAAFSFRGGESFYRGFGGRGGHFAPGLPHGDFPDANGSVGQIIKISLPTIMVTGQDKVEKTVLIKSDTIIRQFRDTLKPEDLKVDDNVVVIGSPNDQGQIEAKLIRLMPLPPDRSGRPAWPTPDFK